MRARGLLVLTRLRGARTRAGRGDGAGTGRPPQRHRRAWLHDHARGRATAAWSRSSIRARTRSRCDDLSDEHNFRLFGPGVEEFTPVETTATVTWTVTFREGALHGPVRPAPWKCSRNSPAGEPPTGDHDAEAVEGGADAEAARHRRPEEHDLAAERRRCRPAPRRRGGGRTRSSFATGRSSDNFHLVGKGVNKKSAVAGTGTTTWKLKLAKGLLRFYLATRRRRPSRARVTRRPDG